MRAYIGPCMRVYGCVCVCISLGLLCVFCAAAKSVARRSLLIEGNCSKNSSCPCCVVQRPLLESRQCDRNEFVHIIASILMSQIINEQLYLNIELIKSLLVGIKREKRKSPNLKYLKWHAKLMHCAHCTYDA